MKPNLAMAYSVKRKAKKKMADGGAVSAASEKRPMPEEMHDDQKMAMQNDHKKALKQSDWTDRPTEKQAIDNNGRKVMPVKHPKMVPNSPFSVRLRDQEDHLQESAKVNDGPQHQPPQDDNEMEADKKGPALLDKSKPHSKSPTIRIFKDGGIINKMVPMHEAEEDEVQHPAHLEEDDDQMAMPVDEYMADHFAKGGMAHEMDMQPEDEEQEEHHDSIAAAIMAKKSRMYAEGGQVDIEENNEEQPNSYYRQNEHAALKENFDSDFEDMTQPMDSNLHGDEREDEEENKHDKISAIRARMKKTNQF